MARSKSNKKPKAKAGASGSDDGGRRSRRRPMPPRRRSLAAYAHDIRTALTGILALGELLASSNLGERERRWASGIKGSAEHLAALTTLMIDAANAEAGSLTLQQETFRPRRLIEALARIRSRRARRPRGSAPSDIADDLPAASRRRSGAVARGAGKSHRQCGEVHRAGRRTARRRAARARRARTRQARLHRYRQRHRA